MIAISWGKPVEPAPVKFVSPRQIMLDIVFETANKHGLAPQDLLRAGRGTSTIANARQEAYYLCHQRTRLPYKTIGHLFSGRDHQTVWHGIRAHEKRMAKACEPPVIHDTHSS